MRWVALFSLIFALGACVEEDTSDAMQDAEPSSSGVRLESVDPRGIPTFRATCDVEGLECHIQVTEYCSSEFGNNPQVVAHRIRNNIVTAVYFRCSAAPANLLPQYLIYG